MIHAKPILTLALVFSVVLTGCMGGGFRGELLRDLELYHVVLHPPNLEWDSETQTLSGNITLSNIPPPTYTRIDDDVLMDRVALFIQFSSDNAPAGKQIARWDIRFDSGGNTVPIYIPNDRAMVFNFSLTPDESIGQVKSVNFRVGYEWDVHLQKPDGIAKQEVLVVYRNPCLEPENDSLLQDTGPKECKPFKWRETHDSRYYMKAGDRITPVEHWNTWTEIWDPLEPARDYLNSFTYEDVLYFNATEYRCGGCLTGGQ